MTDQLADNRVRWPGGGDKPLVNKRPTLLADLLALVKPNARGDPMSLLRWTCKNLSDLASALVAMGHKIGHSALGDLLHRKKFSLQASRKTREGNSHPDREAQFKHLNGSMRAALAEGQPVISVDKKKELVELQRLVTELGINIVVRHLQPGTSMWSKIEHRLLSFITLNWKAKPLVSYRATVDLIAATTSKPDRPIDANWTAQVAQK